MLPLATTTITIKRPAGGSGDPYEDDPLDTVDTGVPGHFSTPSGTAREVGGDAVRIDFVWDGAVEPKIERSDVLVDETTGTTYRVAWATQRRGLGLDHQMAGVVFTEGAAT